MRYFEFKSSTSLVKVKAKALVENVCFMLSAQKASVSVCVCVSVFVYVCLCMCVCGRVDLHVFVNLSTCKMCVNMCVYL